MRSGAYALVISLPEGINFSVGKLGVHNFPSGYYVYAGSALGGLQGRLNHHLKPEKPLHWHIDYLLQYATIDQIWYTSGDDKLECTWNAIIVKLPGAKQTCTRFGSSDCRCYSHLTHFQTIPPFVLFNRNLISHDLPQAHRLTVHLDLSLP